MEALKVCQQNRGVGHQKLKALMQETLILLCKSRLSYQHHFNIEGTVGVTVDDRDVFLFSVHELVKRDTDSQQDVPDLTGTLDMECTRENNHSVKRKLQTHSPRRKKSRASLETKCREQKTDLPTHQLHTVVVTPEVPNSRPTTRAIATRSRSVAESSIDKQSVRRDKAESPMKDTIEMSGSTGMDRGKECGAKLSDNGQMADNTHAAGLDCGISDTTDEAGDDHREHELNTSIGQGRTTSRPSLGTHTRADISVVVMPLNQKYNMDHRTKSLSYTEAIEILANRYDFPMSYTPPYRPKGGQMFIVSAENDKHQLNAWRKDHYHWRTNDGVRTFTNRSEGYNIKKCVHRLSRKGSFTRHGWFLDINPYAVLVHYMGDETEAPDDVSDHRSSLQKYAICQTSELATGHKQSNSPVQIQYEVSQNTNDIQLGPEVLQNISTTGTQEVTLIQNEQVVASNPQTSEQSTDDTEPEHANHLEEVPVTYEYIVSADGQSIHPEGDMLQDTDGHHTAQQ